MTDTTKRLNDPTQRHGESTIRTSEIGGHGAFGPEPGSMVADRYQVIRPLSQSGGEADLFLCLDQEQEVVVKLYRSADGAHDEVLEWLRRVSHRNIIGLLDHGIWQQRLFEVMEFARGGSLADRLPDRPFAEHELTGIVLPQVLAALEFCHSCTPSIIHRDLKPSNIFYRDESETEIVVGDFGISSVLEGDRTHRRTRKAMTQDYAAPEAFSEFIGIEADYYSLGITLLHLLLGHSPFLGSNLQQIMFVHLSGSVPIPDTTSPHLQRLVQGLLVKERNHRWGAGEVRRWLAGEHVPVHASTAQAHKPYRTSIGEEAATAEELARIIQAHPERMSADIQHGFISRWFASFDQDMARRLAAIEESKVESGLKILAIIYTLDPKRPYRLLPGRETADPREFVRFADRDAEGWAAAREQLAKGQVLAWLRAVGYGAIVDQWQALDKDSKASADLALENLLQLLDPNLEKPSVDVEPEALQFGDLEMGESRHLTLTIRNQGRGYLAGQVRLDRAVEGLKLAAHLVRGQQTAIAFSVDASQLPAGHAEAAIVEVVTNGDRVVQVPLHFAVTRPIRQTIETCVTWALACALAFGAARVFLVAQGHPTWLWREFGTYSISWNQISLALGHNPVPFPALTGLFLFCVTVITMIVAARRIDAKR